MAKSATDLLQAVNFTNLLQLVNTYCNKLINFHEVAIIISLLNITTVDKSTWNALVVNKLS